MDNEHEWRLSSRKLSLCCCCSDWMPMLRILSSVRNHLDSFDWFWTGAKHTTQPFIDSFLLTYTLPWHNSVYVLRRDTKKSTLLLTTHFKTFESDKLKPWTNGLASQGKSRQVFNLCSAQLVFCLATHLHWLAIRWPWSISNSYTSRCKFLPFGHPTQVDTTWSQVICICVKFMTFCNLLGLVSKLANLFWKSVGKFWFCKLAST